MNKGEGERETRTIRNRDIILLQSVIYRMRDIESLERRRQWQKDRMHQLTQHLTGMPGGSNTPKGIDEAFARLSELEEEHEALICRYAEELQRAKQVIESIKSGQMRTFVTMMYIENRPSGEVKKKMKMSEWTFRKARDSVEQAENMMSVEWREKYAVEEAE